MKPRFFAFPVLYPFVVQVSLTVLFFSILMVAFLTPRLAWDKYNNARKEMFYVKLRNRYGDILLKIFADKHNYTDEEVLDMTNFKDEGWSGWRMFFVGRLMVETKSKVYDDYNYHNVELNMPSVYMAIYFREAWQLLSLMLMWCRHPIMISTTRNCSSNRRMLRVAWRNL